MEDDDIEFLNDLHEQVKKVKEHKNDLQPQMRKLSSEGQAMVLHRGDDHFGAVVEDENGDTVFDTNRAELRIKQYFDRALELADEKPADFDSVVLLIGGDVVTNEAIFPHQSFEIDCTVDEQIRRATAMYYSQIERLAERFPHVKVVCQHGNHGEFEGSNQSLSANADDIIYDQLELMFMNDGVENVEFVMSDRPNFVNFTVRGHKAHLRHGQHMATHVGTDRPQRDWRGLLHSHGFDIAYRGHYHNHRVENVMGVPVVMTGSICPPGDYEEKQSIFGQPTNYIHGVSDESVLEWIEYVFY